MNEDRIARLLVELREGGLSPSSVHGVLTPLSRVLGYAARRGLIPGNPVHRLDPWGAAEGGAPRDADPRHGRDRGADRRGASELPGLLAVAVFTGLQQGELLGLLWEDVDLDAGIVHVRKQLERSGERVEPKTPQAVREVDLFPALVRVLRAHRQAMLGRGRTKDTDYVFTTEAGTPLYWRNVTARGLRKASDRAGLDGGGKPRLRFHDLRHTFASVLIGQGEDATYVCAQMGHASPRITLDTYARLFDRRRRAEQAKARMELGFGKLLESGGGERWLTRDAGDTADVAPLRRSASGGE